MVNEQQAMTTQNQEVDEVFNFEDFFHIILSHWKLIAMCVILAIGQPVCTFYALHHRIRVGHYCLLRAMTEKMVVRQ